MPNDWHHNIGPLSHKSASSPPVKQPIHCTATTTATMKTALILLLSACCTFVHGAKFGLLRVGGIATAGSGNKNRVTRSEVSSALFDEDLQK